MREYITPERIANSIVQERVFSGYNLIVEGQNDYKVYNMLVDKTNVKIIQANGKENVEKVLKELDKRNFNKKLGIVDSDFDKILNVNNSNKNLLRTDFHDIEVMIFNTKALEKMLNISCPDNNKIKQIEEKKGNSIRNIVLELAEHIARLKLINKTQDLKLMFKPKNIDGNQLKYKKFISEDDLSFLGEDKLIETVLNSFDNRQKNVTNEMLKQAYENTDTSNYNIYDLVNGHDLSNILYILIKKVLKCNSKVFSDYSCVEDCLIYSYHINDIINTDLYRELQKWQDENEVEILQIDTKEDEQLQNAI